MKQPNVLTDLCQETRMVSMSAENHFAGTRLALAEARAGKVAARSATNDASEDS